MRLQVQTKYRYLMSLKFENYILDNVNGFIGLTQIEQEIERLPVFQRLRHIKQLGLASWIFPGSEHTRYIHSLGVMHTADKMATKLQFKDHERQFIRLAALLHDIGHYPLSHIGEYAYRGSSAYADEEVECQFKNSVKTVKEKIDSLVEYRPLDDAGVKSTGGKFHHERIGEYLIRNHTPIRDLLERNSSVIINENQKGIDEYINDLCSVITGNLTDDNLHLAKFIQLLHSEMDADRIDYLLRDASFTGTSYGLFEVQSLVRNLELKKHPEYGVDIVGVNIKGVGAAEQFLISRYLAYSQVIFHKHVAALTCMAEILIRWMALDVDYFWKPQDLHRLIRDMNTAGEAFIDFNDQYFSEQVRHLCNDKRLPNLNDIKHLATALKNMNAFELASRSGLFLSGKRENLYEKIMNSNFWNDVSNPAYNHNSDRLLVFNEVNITKHVPIDEFEKAYNDMKVKTGEDDMPDYSEYKRDRLLDGIVIIESDENMYNLVDASHSLIKDLSRYTLVKIYEYSIPD